MAVKLSWYYPQRILYARLFDTITDHDDQTLERTIQQYLATVNPKVNGQPIHLIADYSDVEAMESFVTPVEAVTGSPAVMNHPALGYRLTVARAGNPVLRYLRPFMSHVLRLHEPSFGALEDAVAYLCTLDRTLPRNLSRQVSRSIPRPA